MNLNDVETWMIDETLKSVPVQFDRFLTINFYIFAKVILVIYVLPKKKHKKVEKKIFENLLNK